MKNTINIKSIKGIGEKTAALFNKLDIYTVDDLVNYYPRTYVEYPQISSISDCTNNQLVALKLYIPNDFKWKKVKNITIGSGICNDKTNKISITIFNSLYLKSKLTSGRVLIFYGNIEVSNGNYFMKQPTIYNEDDYEILRLSLQPIYHLTKGLSNKTVLKAIKTCIEDEQYTYEYNEILSENILNRFNLVNKVKALNDIHFPQSIEEFKKARKRLSFDELLTFLLILRSYKGNGMPDKSSMTIIETAQVKRLIERLPYKLTTAQLKVLDEISNDLTSGYIMNRLIQGDVGSGKTIIAFLSMLMCVDNGYQTAFMAPTEILAIQHFSNLSKLTKDYDLPFRVALLTGSTKQSEKRQIYEDIKNGKINCVIGTHALIQDKINFKNLSLVITDEQHRFGVKQRQALANKGNEPHVLIMSATPIPRTLSIVLYGDMHLSVINTKPANRLPIKNCVVGTKYRPKAYDFIKSEIDAGHQAYIICPMVESNDGVLNVTNVIDYTDEIKKIFPENIRIEYLHGKMKSSLKDNIMTEFLNHNIDILVSTTVIEVGVDVPNATVIMIENAERFGLSQLHQLRGRIGRSDKQSYAIFINCNNDENKRLNILNDSNDGFYIAEEDLKLRGAGDIFGIRQSGEIGFEIADIIEDSDMIMDINSYLDEVFTNKDNNKDILDSFENLKNENLNKFIDFKTI